MTPSKIYDIFRENFPGKAPSMISYKRVDANAIELKALNGFTYIFRVLDNNGVSLERKILGKGLKKNESN